MVHFEPADGNTFL